MESQPPDATRYRGARLHSSRAALSWTGPWSDECAEYRLHRFHICQSAQGVWTLTVMLPRGGRRTSVHRSHPTARQEALTFAQSL